MALDQALLKYPGAKWQLANWIIEHLPRHTHYVEPYAGSLAVFFSKQPSAHEVVNDLSQDIVNFFRVIRDQPGDLADLLTFTPWSREEYYLSYERTGDALEDARRFTVRAWQAHGFKLSGRTGWRHNGVKSVQPVTVRWSRLPEIVLAAAARLKNAEIECKPALEIIARYNAADVLLYVDPPYVLDTRSKNKLYQHEMEDSDHLDLLDTLNAHQGPVVLSGYDHPLYTERLVDWQVVATKARADKGATRTEVLWLNQHAQPMQARMF